MAKKKKKVAPHMTADTALQLRTIFTDDAKKLNAVVKIIATCDFDSTTYEEAAKLIIAELGKDGSADDDYYED